MNKDLKAFVISYLRVMFVPLLACAVLAFVCIPYSLGSMPGDTHSPVAGVDKHAT